MVVIGYSGHAYVAANILMLSGTPVTHYCDVHAKDHNPYQLQYLGKEDEPAAIEFIKSTAFFIAVGNNQLREKIFNKFKTRGIFPVNIIHPRSCIAADVQLNCRGSMISAGTIVNPQVTIGDAVILNTGCVVEHECNIGSFVHVAPGALLCGNVQVGAGSFIGAGAVVRQGITIGKNVMVGAGAVVVKNVDNNAVVMGNPAREVFGGEGRV